MIKAFAFDIFGTLVDLMSVSKVFSKVNIKINNLELFTEMWQSNRLGTIYLIVLSFLSFVPNILLCHIEPPSGRVIRDR
jgi:hypothetical protein